MQILKKLSLCGVKEVKGTEVSQVLSHTPLKGQKLLAQGIALGNYVSKPVALQGQKL